jgi:CRISPR-associated protein Cas2
VYVIVVYDVEQERVAKVCQFLRRYLNWVQNSAFEGELTLAQLEAVKNGLKEILHEERDSVYLYILRDARWVTKQILGRDKGHTDAVL